MSTPLMLLSDAVDSRSGLGRITRDLATVASTLPEFRVASLGRGALGSCRLPWMQYGYPATPDGQWGEHYLQHAWQDFSRNQPGVIMTVWDASRLLWFARPDVGGLTPEMSEFLTKRNFAKWGYFPIDSSGPDPSRLPHEAVEILKGFDRVIVASEWAVVLCRNSGISAEWAPHGLDLNTFRCPNEQERLYRRDAEGVKGRTVVGSCMTNQARKDYPTLFHTAAILRQSYPDLLLWLHTDTAFSYWNVMALATDYGIADILKVTYTGQFDDRRMAAFYAACDVTLLISGGEGWGYPIAESQACGTPCVTQAWAAGGELVEEFFRVQSLAFRLETQHNCLRAIYDAGHVAEKVAEVIEKAKLEGQPWREEIADRVSYLGWSKLKHVWSRWLREGIA